jgi:hypothetical protein
LAFSPNVLDQFDKRQGAQVPISRIAGTGSMLGEPGGVAIGP